MSQDKDLSQNLDFPGSMEDQLMSDYAKAFTMLLAYDEDELIFPPRPERPDSLPLALKYKEAREEIDNLRDKLQAGELFGLERGEGILEGILNSLEQTFEEKPLYKSREAKVAHLLYFIVKDHPFVDGNKRIGAWLFLKYLKILNMFFPINYHGLFQITIWLTESDPQDKDKVVERLIEWITVSDRTLR